jgi:tetratricopeptide (TPR) repeat protein
MLVVLAITVVFAETAAIPSVPALPENLRAPMERAETMLYSETGSSAEFTTLFDQMQNIINRDLQGVEQHYWNARLALLRATRLNEEGNGRAAARAAQTGLSYIDQALESGDFSDGLRVLTDLHSQMMMARGLIYMVRHGETARAAAFRARELDPANVRALISVAGFYLNAPPIAGGDVQEGIKVLHSALALNPPNQNDRFIIFGWLAEAHARIDAGPEARRYLDEARQIYPRSPWIRSIAGETLTPQP